MFQCFIKIPKIRKNQPRNILFQKIAVMSAEKCQFSGQKIT